MRLDAGGEYNYWIPQPIQGASVTTEGYFSYYVDVKASLWNRIHLFRFNLATTGGLPPPTDGSYEPDADDSQLTKVAALMLDVIAGIRFGDSWSIAGRYKTWTFSSTVEIDAEHGLFFPFDTGDLEDETSSVGMVEGEDAKFTTTFKEYWLGALIQPRIRSGEIDALIGLLFLKFQKPWFFPEETAKLSDGSAFFDGRFSGVGIGVAPTYRKTAGDERVKHSLVIQGDIGLGFYGNVELLSDFSLRDLLDKDHNLGFVLLGGQVGYTLEMGTDWFHVLANISVGARYNTFFVYESKSKSDSSESDQTNLNSDVLLNVKATLGLQL